ncbi:MAG: DUF1667 domain-containing protein [Firmicutes bacterium]|nr:DUF1667 domain-containing protein [Bacillota bacterium]
MKKQLTCIVCPRGCQLTVNLEGPGAPTVEGYACKRGIEYAKQEAVRPMRVLTANMKASGCAQPFSVRTSAPIPKERILECAAALKRCRPKLPIRIGDVVVPDVLSLGVDIIATQSLDISDKLDSLVSIDSDQ